MQHTLINLPLFIILLTSSLSCSKPNEPAESEWYVLAKKDGIPWRGEAYAGINYDGSLAISGTTFDSRSFRRDQIAWYTPASIGKHLPLDGFFAIHTDDGDVLKDYFRIIKQAPDSTAITQYDSSTGIITGSFSLRFKHDKDSTWIISFTEGTFRAKLGVGRR
jgi:hypothetical protein